MSETQRNFAILIAVAIGAYFAFQGFNIAAGYIMLVFGILFAVFIGILMYRWHTANKRKIRQMDFGWQVLLYFCGLSVMLFMGVQIAFAMLGVPTIVSYIFLAACIYGIYQCVQNLKRYW